MHNRIVYHIFCCWLLLYFQSLRSQVTEKDEVIEAGKVKVDELMARVAELEASMEKLQVEKAAQEEELKLLQVC